MQPDNHKMQESREAGYVQFFSFSPQEETFIKILSKIIQKLQQSRKLFEAGLLDSQSTQNRTNIIFFAIAHQSID